MSELPKTFDPTAIETRWYTHWEENGLFRPDRPGAEPWTIVNPPPNVTGSLHIGHALDNTLQDILTRHARLKGKDALWVVGMDHAGIATQMVVERQMNAAGQKRTDFSREDFISKVWEWKAESGGAITGQLRRLGCSMDWANERFTMDPGFSKAVLKVFVDLYKQGLLSRAKRLVNWDPALKTAISDLEVESREVQGHMWHFKYPLAGGETYTYIERDAEGNVVLEEERDYISIATTRPETMLGDGAVAVHPDDERYRPIVGKLCEIPVGPKALRRLIPIITDSYPDPHFGSGAVKITGAHDENDYGVAQRNNIPMYRLMDQVAAMRSDGAHYAVAAARAQEIAGGAPWTATEVDTLNLVPDQYRGLDRYEARKRVVADIDADGLMIKVEDKLIMQPFGDRGGVVIEPMLTDQWYVDAATLAKGPIEAVKSGAIKIVPKSWEKTFFNWMENIQPWCVSRQLWWGHRIPVWYGPRDANGELEYDPTGRDCEIFVAETEEEAIAQAVAFYGEGATARVVEDLNAAIVGGMQDGSFNPTERLLVRDPDVLDTWFSSALWPFATMGWPDDGEWRQRYPNDVLISGFDILFFWDARMMMQGMHFLKEVPFRTLYLHGLVRAADGAKMSKSKGNTVDPLGLIDKYGADALRFFMAAMESQGRDIKMDEKRVEGYRNFATKLWNAARFCQSNGIVASAHMEPPAATLAVNKWIIGEVVQTVQAMDLAFADYRFDGAADAIYHFVWSRFCDWYLELIKPVLQGEGAEGAEETRAVAGWALDQILVLLHPFMPFITEELWHAMGSRADYPLITAKWPIADARALDPEAGREIDWVILVIEQIRSQRLETGFKATDKIPLGLASAPSERVEMLNRNVAAIARIARVQPAKIDISSSDGGSTSWAVTIQNSFEVIEVDRTGVVSAQFPVGDVNFLAFTDGFIDLEAERARLTKAIGAAEKERDSLAGRLNNPSFVERAKPEAVEKARADHAEKAAEAERLGAALARLG